MRYSTHYVLSTKSSIPPQQLRARGISLVEMLVALVMIGIIAVGTLEIILINHMYLNQFINKVDGINAARTCIDKISRIIRMGRSVGDSYGDDTTLAEARFPAQHNPIYGAGGFTYPTKSSLNDANEPLWPPGPYRLSTTTLIVQVPIFFTNPVNTPGSPSYDSAAAQDLRNGFPTMISSENDKIQNPQDSNSANLETYVYQVLPHPANAGEWVLSMAKFPGTDPFTEEPPPGPFYPQTLLKGIVGPLDANGQPEVFQYIQQSPGKDFPPTIKSPPRDPGVIFYRDLPYITGVIINLEMINKEEALRDRITALKAEVFLRNNMAFTTVGN